MPPTTGTGPASPWPRRRMGWRGTAAGWSCPRPGMGRMGWPPTRRAWSGSGTARFGCGTRRSPSRTRSTPTGSSRPASGASSPRRRTLGRLAWIHPPSAYTGSVERRIFGLENEYGVTRTVPGERILEGLLSAAQIRLHEEGISGDVFLFKNNTDSAGNSYGCHENYLVARQGEFARMAEVLIPFFVTRQVFAGAGKVLHGPRGAQFCISQRAEHIWEGVSSATTRSRPIINTRDEPHADAERYRRLHVIVGDSNMSEFTTYLKVGVTDLVLRMVEENSVMRDLTMENPIRAIREISHDITCRKKIRLANGRELSALDIQSEYHDRAVKYAARRGLDPAG